MANVHDWYDWLKDIGLPALVGVGSIAVGAVAILVARQSHNLAEQVRADEVKRDAEDSCDRYQDQLFRAIEPAMSAVIEYSNEVNTVHQVDTANLRKLRSSASSRLKLAQSVASGDDYAIVTAIMICYYDVAAHPLWEIQAYASSALAGYIASLVAEGRNAALLVAEVEGLIDRALANYKEVEGLID